MRKEPFNPMRPTNGPEINREGDKGMRTNNPEWTEARQISDNLVEQTEITERQTKISFYSEKTTDLDYVEFIFKNGLQVDPGRIANVQITETVVTTYTRSRKS